ncbi:hypothetical protein JCM5296_000116 [Sporobolomyces johnsonii]
MRFVSLPDVPAGENPFTLYLVAVDTIVNPRASPGFAARLAVLHALVGYGIVVAFCYLVMMGFEYRRRKKRFWLWRLVQRANGRYIVGNQTGLFALFTLVSCGVMIGYVLNARRVVLLAKYQQRAAFWRSLVWVPLICHAWVSSFANLQSAILSSQKATDKHLLSPRVANTLYVGVLPAVLVVAIVLDVFSAYAWRHAWSKAVLLRDFLLVMQRTSPTATGQQAMDIVRPQLDPLNVQLTFFAKTLEAVCSIYVVVSALIIAVNIGGLGLLFTLRRQIKFNSNRLAFQVRSAMPDPISRPSTPSAGLPPSSYFPDPAATPSFLPSHTHGATPSKSLLRKVLFARHGEHDAEEAGDTSSKGNEMSVSPLKETAADKTQRAQLLALKKIESDLFVFIAAILILASCFAGMCLWIAIAPNSVYRSWTNFEVAYFLVPWLYLVLVDSALTFLLYNLVNHLTKTSTVASVGLSGQGSKRVAAKRNLSGMTTSEELESVGISQAQAATVATTEHVRLDMNEGKGVRPPGSSAA